MEILTAIIEILLGALTEVGAGIGAALSSLVTSIFLTTGGALSTFGTLVVVFGAISLAFGLCYLIVHWIAHLGKGKL